LIEKENLSYKKASTADTTTSAECKNPIKKVHCVSNKLFIVIDESIAKSLDISENDAWFEQIQTKDGILLRKYLRSQVSG
jgi:hypothetical protein